jgi:hypothetical protein
MLKYTILILISQLLNATIVTDDTNSFITEQEYGKMLYNNPRGIGCNLCHGNNGQGKVITTYKDKKKDDNYIKTYIISAPKINNLDFNYFINYINNIKSKSIMPKYFLTNDELRSIYIYLEDKNNDN